MNKTKKLKFSICIFTYNRAEYLDASIKSALNQIYQNYEIVIVDDGSDDNTEEIVKSFNSSKIKYIRKEHSGAPKTRNRAIQEADGEYIVWLADDDMLLPAALQYYSIYLNQDSKIDVLYSHIRMFESDSEETSTIIANDWYKKNDEALAFLLKGSPVTDGGCAVRKKVYEEIGNYNEEYSRAQDYEFWSRIIQKQKYILKLVPKYLYLYRIHTSNITGKFNENTDFSFEVKILEKLVNDNSLQELFPKLNWKKDQKECEFQAYFFLTMKHLFIKSAEVGTLYLEKAKEIRSLTSSEIDRIKEIIGRFNSIESTRIVELATQTSTQNIFAIYEQAIEEIEKGNYLVAEKKLDSIIENISFSENNHEDIEVSDVKLLVGNISLINGDYEKATELFEDVLESDPNSSEACQGLGELLLINNNIESAKTMFEWAIENNSENQNAKIRLNEINKKMNLPEEHNSLIFEKNMIEK